MEGRLALWLRPACTPADRGRLCQEEGRDQRDGRMDREREGGREGVLMLQIWGPLEMKMHIRQLCGPFQWRNNPQCSQVDPWKHTQSHASSLK